MNKKIPLLLILCSSIFFPTRSSFAADIRRDTRSAITTRDAATSACRQLKTSRLLDHVADDTLVDFLEEKIAEKSRVSTQPYCVLLRDALRRFGNPVFEKKIQDNPFFLIGQIIYLHDFETQLYLEAGAQANIANDDGVTALHMAALCGMAIAANALIARGANVNAKTNGENATPLHMLATTYSYDSRHRPSPGRVSINLVGTLDVLVTKGAKLDALDNKGRSPLDVIREFITTKSGRASPEEIALCQAFEKATNASLATTTTPAAHDTKRVEEGDDRPLTVDD